MGLAWLNLCLSLYPLAIHSSIYQDLFLGSNLGYQLATARLISKTEVIGISFGCIKQTLRAYLEGGYNISFWFVVRS